MWFCVTRTNMSNVIGISPHWTVDNDAKVGESFKELHHMLLIACALLELLSLAPTHMDLVEDKSYGRSKSSYLRRR